MFNPNIALLSHRLVQVRNRAGGLSRREINILPYARGRSLSLILFIARAAVLILFTRSDRDATKKRESERVRKKGGRRRVYTERKKAREREGDKSWSAARFLQILLRSRRAAFAESARAVELLNAGNRERKRERESREGANERALVCRIHW